MNNGNTHANCSDCQPNTCSSCLFCKDCPGYRKPCCVKIEITNFTDGSCNACELLNSTFWLRGSDDGFDTTEFEGECRWATYPCTVDQPLAICGGFSWQFALGEDSAGHYAELRLLPLVFGADPLIVYRKDYGDDRIDCLNNTAQEMEFKEMESGLCTHSGATTVKFTFLDLLSDEYCQSGNILNSSLICTQVPGAFLLTIEGVGDGDPYQDMWPPQCNQQCAEYWNRDFIVYLEGSFEYDHVYHWHEFETQKCLCCDNAKRENSDMCINDILINLNYEPTTDTLFLDVTLARQRAEAGVDTSLWHDPYIHWRKVVTLSPPFDFPTEGDCLAIDETGSWTRTEFHSEEESGVIARNKCDWSESNIRVRALETYIPCSAPAIECPVCAGDEGPAQLKITIPSGHWTSTLCDGADCSLYVGEFILDFDADMSNPISGCYWRYRFPGCSPISIEPLQYCCYQELRVNVFEFSGTVYTQVTIFSGSGQENWRRTVAGTEINCFALTGSVPYITNGGTFRPCNWDGSGALTIAVV